MLSTSLCGNIDQSKEHQTSDWRFDQVLVTLSATSNVTSRGRIVDYFKIFSIFTVHAHYSAMDATTNGVQLHAKRLINVSHVKRELEFIAG